MKKTNALLVLLGGLISANNAYQFIGTSYHTSYWTWFTVSFTLNTIGFYSLFKNWKDK